MSYPGFAHYMNNQCVPQRSSNENLNGNDRLCPISRDGTTTIRTDISTCPVSDNLRWSSVEMVISIDDKGHHIEK